MIYWRVQSYNGVKQHYAETRDGEPYKRALCGAVWSKKVGPATEPLPDDCRMCREVMGRAQRKISN